MRLPRPRVRPRGQEGGVLVFFAVFAPVAILFLALVVNAGESWWHKRHLQVQADAAALAAAMNFQPCSDSTITSEAQQYGGVAGNPVYNAQIGGAYSGGIHELINSRTFYGQATPVDPTVSTNPPCSSMMVDVKMTETSLPWYIKIFRLAFNGVPYVNAQARVQAEEVTSTGPGAAPLAVDDVSFTTGEAFFVNESTGQVVGHSTLAQTGISNGLSLWSSAANPYSLTVPTGAASDVGVRIAMSATSNLTGNMSTDCALPGVLCFDSSSSSAQLLDVHGWSSSGSGSLTAPLARQVTLTPGTCGDPYYTSSFYTTASSCTDNVSARIDFGASPNLSGITVAAVAGKSSTKLSCTSASPAVCTGTVAFSTGAGRTPVDITVKNGNTTTTFAGVQSMYAAGANSGPIQQLTLYDTGSGLTDTSSLQQGSTHSLVVNMGITPSLAVAQSVSDPVVVMRLDGSGSQNQSVQCTPVSTPPTISDPFAAALATGCTGSYKINVPLACPDPTDPTNSPIDCLNPATGNKTNQPAKGLNYRILGSVSPSVCSSPNHWSSFPYFSPTDPRIVTVFVTPYSSFGGSGSSQQFPIQYFATFYITGWQGQGQGFTNPCQGNGDDTAPAGTVVGHFISYINTLNQNSGGGATCVANSLNQCVTVQTR